MKFDEDRVSWRMKYKGYTIGRTGFGYYVCTIEDNVDNEMYLHKNLILNTYCGSENFYDSLKEAKGQIDIKEYKTGKYEFLTEGDFSS